MADAASQGNYGQAFGELGIEVAMTAVPIARVGRVAQAGRGAAASRW